jgi:oxygen-independent coproporphyrinogen-3 oxidase
VPEQWVELVERDGHGVVEELPLQPIERAREMLLMGLRLVEGIDPALFAERTGVALADSLDTPMLQQALEAGYLASRGEHLAATASGRLRLDALLAAIVR